jgi:hypothetical protein
MIGRRELIRPFLLHDLPPTTTKYFPFFVNHLDSSASMKVYANNISKPRTKPSIMNAYCYYLLELERRVREWRSDCSDSLRHLDEDT